MRCWFTSELETICYLAWPRLTKLLDGTLHLLYQVVSNCWTKSSKLRDDCNSFFITFLVYTMWERSGDQTDQGRIQTYLYVSLRKTPTEGTRPIGPGLRVDNLPLNLQSNPIFFVSKPWEKGDFYSMHL